MKRTLALLFCAAAIGSYGCGNDDTNNGASNNGGSNNGTSNNSASNNDTTGTNDGESNNGATNNDAGTNNDTTQTNNTTGGTNNDTAGSNNGTGGTNNDTTNAGDVRVNVSYTPNAGPEGTEVTATFTLTNFTFNHEAIGMAHVEGEGHYHVYLDTAEEANELLVSGMNPGTIPIMLEGSEITQGPHSLVFRVHKNDHTEFSDPIEFNVAFLVTAP